MLIFINKCLLKNGYIVRMKNGVNADPSFDNSVDLDQLASDEASWSGSTLLSKEGIKFWKRKNVSLLFQVSIWNRANLGHAFIKLTRARNYNASLS